MIKNTADWRPVSLILAGVTLSLTPFIFDGPIFIALALAGVLMRALIPIHQHYHSHNATFKSPALNQIYDVFLSIGGGNITALWKVHHGLGHHVDYLDQHNDVEGNLRFGEHIPFRRLVFTVLGDGLSLYDSFALLKKFPKAVQKAHRGSITTQFLIQLGLFALLFAASPALTLAVFILPNLILRWSVFWFSYGQHDDLPMTSVYNSSTTKFKLNALLLNVGLHTAHHEKPGLHWSKLGERTEQILPLIDASCLPKQGA
ncbi:MAG: fatty acid desaturase [Bdellovibrionaceae bacterium]|nr:fatty acid desaturase [Pseudobdellovibrionaceae bacterium]